MAASRRFEIAELFPQPKEVILGEGISELAGDVRLSTSNVLPIQRKALRSILTMAGVRVVANKKKYVVDAQVLDPENFDLSRVPEAVRKDYYELEIKGSEVFIRTPAQEGTVWAAQTLASLFATMFRGRAVPNLLIRDWPMVPYRGSVTAADWGTERMDPNGWYQALDAMSAMHLNLCGIGVYNCVPEVRTSRYDRPSEFLLANIHEEPVPGDPASHSRLRYYNEKYDRWYDREVSPVLAENDSFDEVLVYGRERGVILFPMMELLNGSTLLPKLFPALSACDEKGHPLSYGLCLSSAKGKEALEGFLGDFLQRYFEDGVPFFHIGLAKIDACHPHAEDGLPEGPWCHCAKCKKLTPSAQLAVYLRELVDFLCTHGVGKVVFFADCLFQKGDFLGKELKALFQDEEFASRVILHWQDEKSRTSLKAPVRAILQKSAGQWRGPLANQGAYASFSRNLEGVDAEASKIVKDGLNEGVVVRGQFDPLHWEQVSMLGVRCWETPSWTEDTIDGLRKRWASLRWNGVGEDYLALLDRVDALSKESLCQKTLPWKGYLLDEGAKDHVLSAWPENVLSDLAQEKGVSAKLEALAHEATEIVEKTASLMGASRWNDLQTASLQSMMTVAQKTRIVLEFFVTLLKLREAIFKKSGGAAAAKKILQVALPQLVTELKVIEENSPDCLLWINMQQLGCLKLILENIQEDLDAGKKNAKDLRWSLPKDWEAPQE